MKAKTIYISLVAIIVIGFAGTTFLLLNTRRSVAHADTFANSTTFTTVSAFNDGTSVQVDPKVHDLPVDFSLTQTLKFRKFLSQFSRDNNLAVAPEAYYRSDSAYKTTSGEAGLVDIPSVKQTLLVETVSNDTLNIRCALPIDQKEVAWNCSDDSLGESE